MAVEAEVEAEAEVEVEVEVEAAGGGGEGEKRLNSMELDSCNTFATPLDRGFNSFEKGF